MREHSAGVAGEAKSDAKHELRVPSRRLAQVGLIAQAEAFAGLGDMRTNFENVG
jgi:hypothetical protein